MQAGDREFWERNSGVSATPGDVDRAAAGSAAARSLMDSTALSADQVAVLLHLAPSTVRRHSADRKLYAYRVGDELLFPAWQFNAAGDNLIPSLEAVLSVLSADLHPQSVAGFFLTPQPDLVLDGSPVSAKAWLEAGGPANDVTALARELAAGY